MNRCAHFERQWRGGQPAPIEVAIREASDFDCPVLFRELLAIEVECRLLAGEQPSPADYAIRFPHDCEVVERVFEETAQLETNDGERSETNCRRFDQSTGLKLPQQFSDYELLEEIAHGGMGIVYRARQISLDRTVAVKMILAGRFASAVEIERFNFEARAAAQLVHPNIVPIIEVGQIDGQHYFSMAYIEGTSLADRIAAGPLPADEAAELVREVAVALDYAHGRGVFHRDLKPANILLDRGHHAHVTDFGLAKLAHDRIGPTITGDVLGTPSYMPPEQTAGKTNLIRPASDVYSLGAVLYAALTGRPPFQAASALDTLKQLLEQDPIAPCSTRPYGATRPGNHLPEMSRERSRAAIPHGS